MELEEHHTEESQCEEKTPPINSHYTQPHRAVIHSRDAAFSQFAQEVASKVTTVIQKYNTLEKEETEWILHWQQMVNRLTEVQL